MASHPVAQQGEQILKQEAQPILDEEFGGSTLKNLVTTMQRTMDEKLGVGIAAPQIFVSKRVIIVASRPNLRYPDAPLMEPLVMVNPKILNESLDQVMGEEGCLSVPEQRGQVLRAHAVLVRYQNILGQIFEKQFQGFPARIVQHEIDHLNGILFVDRLN